MNSERTQDHGIFWAAMRQRDLLVGFAIFVAANVLLLGIVVLGQGTLGHDGSHDAKVAFAVIAVALNLLIWLWNDAGIKDVAASNKDLEDDDRQLAIVQEFLKAPWAFYRAIVLIVTVLVAGSLVYAVFW